MPQCPMVERRGPSAASWGHWFESRFADPEGMVERFVGALALCRAVGSLDSCRRMERPLMPTVELDEMPYEPCGGAAPSARRRHSSSVAIMSLIWRCGRTRVRDGYVHRLQGMP